MLLLAIVLAVPLERFGAELPWDMPLMAQSAVCGVAITAVEFVATAARLEAISRHVLCSPYPALLTVQTGHNGTHLRLSDRQLLVHLVTCQWVADRCRYGRDGRGG